MSRGKWRGLQVSLGFATEKGRRPDNQDYVAAYLDDQMQRSVRGVVAVVADGVGGHKGGRQASETAVRSFIDAYYALPETLGVKRAASQALETANQWIHAQGRLDPQLSGMSCTFSCLILTRRAAHILHVGDTRIYRSSENRLDLLTSDHVAGQGDFAHMLKRAIGFEESVKVDHLAIGLRQHDRFLICSDGVHGSLSDMRLKALLEQRATPDESARIIVDAALAAGSKDNATALVLDVIDIPPADQDELATAVASLPILPVPEVGDVVDGFTLGGIISDGRYSRLLRATDGKEQRTLALKFPRPLVAAEKSYRLAFIREVWVAARVRSSLLGEVVEIPAGRQTRLYSVMPFYDGETLEQRIKRSPLPLSEGVDIAIKLARAINALHRAGVVHRDIKPDNVILTRDGGLRLLDLGVALVPHVEDVPIAGVAGTPSFMAPELFKGKAGDEASDLYALGATTYRMFTAAYPYGEVEPFMTPRFAKYASLARARPELPAWLDAVIAKSVSVNPAHRQGDVIEFAHELEHGSKLAVPMHRRKLSFYERDPLRFWKLVALALLLCVIALVGRVAML